MKRNKIVIGTRSSKLALIYADKVKNEFEKFYDGEIIIKKINTSGDNNLKVRLSELGGKGLFSKNIEEELVNDKIDIAVHALKDLPCNNTEGLKINCFLKRNNSNEVMISNTKKHFNELAPGSIIGTSSFRREFQLKRKRKDLNFKLIRGNVDTRIKKLKSGEYDAIILSKAGLSSLNLEKEITQEFSVKELIPSAGQGAIAIQCRINDGEMLGFLEKINHSETRMLVNAEREVLKVLDGDCETAVGVTSEIREKKLFITAELFSIDGNTRFFCEASSELKESEKTGKEVGKKLKLQSKGNYKK
ncbi:MAG: hydroxymethylbilane synthase [Flavobacteriales bacterium]|nr:hydroxymethylbilane synthase [Flavobacteriales bacterium]|tara:strand:+ start:4380 stop:5291 length:912 start_codon:yes stop_codon:yes gene_type:complete